VGNFTFISTKRCSELSVVEQEVRTTIDELLKVISTKNVISEPIEVGDNVVITITKVGLGFGTGTGEGKNTNSTGSGKGAGGAAGVSPVAVVVIHKNTPGPEGVEVKSLTPPSGIGKAIGEIASRVVERMGPMKPPMKKEEQQGPVQ
jgi:uncharacterized spore protein YtfJ